MHVAAGSDVHVLTCTLGEEGEVIPPELALVSLFPTVTLAPKAAQPGSPLNLGLNRPYNNLAVLYARKLFTRLPSDHGRVVQVLPVASAVIITALGLVLTARSLPGVM